MVKNWYSPFYCTVYQKIVYSTSSAANDANNARQQASSQITEILQWSTSEQNYDHSQGLTVIKFQADHSKKVKTLAKDETEEKETMAMSLLMIFFNFLRYSVPHRQ